MATDAAPTAGPIPNVKFRRVINGFGTSISSFRPLDAGPDDLLRPK
jgi:hypothetical protein